jgi:hypothetical protein
MSKEQAAIRAYLNANPLPLYLQYTAGKGTNAKQGRGNRKDYLEHLALA